MTKQTRVCDNNIFHCSDDNELKVPVSGCDKAKRRGLSRQQKQPGSTNTQSKQRSWRCRQQLKLLLYWANECYFGEGNHFLLSSIDPSRSTAAIVEVAIKHIVCAMKHNAITWYCWSNWCQGRFCWQLSNTNNETVCARVAGSVWY